MPKALVSISAKNAEQKDMLRTIAQNDITFVKGVPGTGKCISPTSVISTNHGLVQFSKLINENLAEDDYAHHISTIVNKHGEYEQTSKIYNSGEKETLIISTEHGYEIEGTPNHRILCLTDVGQEWKQLDGITTEDFICISRSQPAPSCALQFDKDVAYFVGMMIGDGSYTLDHSFSLSNIDDYLITFFYRFCIKQFDIEPTQSKSRPCDHYLCSKEARHNLIKWGLNKVSGENKTIPDYLMTVDHESQCSLLRGLFDTDGWVEKSGQVCFVNKSLKLCRQVHIMLLRLGIVSRLSKISKQYDGESREYNKIIIRLSSCKLFNDLIGFNVGYKQSRLMNILSRSRNTNKDVIPSFYSKKILRKYWDKLEGHRNRKTNAMFMHYITKNADQIRSISYSKLSEIYSKYKDEFPDKDIENLLNTNYFYDKVKIVSNGKSKVYDFVVPKSHSFVANGFVNHNTYVAVGYALQELLKNNYENIILTRPVVEAGEKLGFLPGDMEDKINPYMIPIFYSMKQILGENRGLLKKLTNKNGKDPRIRILPLAYMRGVTFSKSVIICDEMQNATPEQMRMVLTRFGQESKMILCGDVKQSDIYKRNGLEDAFELLQDIPGIGFVTLSRAAVVRHPIIAKIDDRYNQRNSSKERHLDRAESFT